MSNGNFVAPASTYLVPFDGKFKLDEASTKPPKGEGGKKRNKPLLDEDIEANYELARKLYADDRFSLLLVFQAMDAAGKDSTIRSVMTGVNPANTQIYSFKRPSSEQLDHDFLWRVYSRLPERGRIGIFNRSHYEEVLVVRVFPEFLEAQRLPPRALKPGKPPTKQFWEERFESIRAFEQHAARNGTTVLKFFLNVSKDEQKERLLRRLRDEHRNWKFEAGDLATRARWDDFMSAYEKALNETSRPWAPWYCIPADDKPFMRRTVAGIVRQALEALPLEWPRLAPEELARIDEYRAQLEAD